MGTALEGILVRPSLNRFIEFRRAYPSVPGNSNTLALGLVLAASLMGCSSNSRYGVEGRVTYAGEPLELGSITFLPEADQNIKGGGVIVRGHYKVEPYYGLNPGPHRVEIRWAKPTGKKYKNEFGEVLDVRKEGLIDKYHTKSTMSVTIRAGANTLDFDLEK
jgi:hypothetical protein